MDYLPQFTSRRPSRITGSAFALHCCKAYAKINMKMGNSTPFKIVIHENLNMKLGRHDYVVDISYHASLVEFGLPG